MARNPGLQWDKWMILFQGNPPNSIALEFGDWVWIRREGFQSQSSKRPGSTRRTMIHIAMVRYLKRGSERRAYWGSSFEGVVHRGEEVMAERAWAGPSHCTHSQEAERWVHASGLALSFRSELQSVWMMLLPSEWLFCLQRFWTHSLRHAQRPVSMRTLNLDKSTRTITPTTWSHPWLHFYGKQSSKPTFNMEGTREKLTFTYHYYQRR